MAPTGEFATGTRLHNTDAFDAADLGGFCPFAAAHVHFGVIDAEGFDLNDDVPGFRLGLRNIFVDEAVEVAEFLKNDGAHG